MSKFPLITDPFIHKYCEDHSTHPNPLCQEIAEISETTGQVIMIAGPALGNFLKLIVMSKQPKRILEVGTFTGYGTICLSESMPNDCILHTIELSKNNYNLAKPSIEKSNKADNIVMHLGDGAEMISQIDEAWDLVFIDAAKRQYSLYYDLVFPKLNPGGIIIADNVLWKGKVGHPDNDNLGKGLEAFNEKIAKDDRVTNLIIPIDDGVNFIIKN